MTNDQIGQACAMGTAISWAMAVVLFKRAGDRVPPMLLNLFKNVVGVLLLAVTLAALGQGWHTLDAYPRSDIFILAISGILGIAIADTIFFHALNRCGVGLMSIVDCSYSPCVLFFSFLLLGETLTAYHAIGGVLVLAGVFTASRHAPPPGRTRGQIVTGICLGVLAMALMAYGIVLAKPVLDERNFPLFWATTIRMVAGTGALAIALVLRQQWAQCKALFTPSRTWLTTVPAAVLGAYISMVLWVGGFKYTKASVAAILNQTSVIFALLLASVILQERLTRRKLLAVTLAMTGVVLIIFWGRPPGS
ncbi:MAG TPA: DMT family transporter [Phycisphaerae bacterium]|nr:DMT family transporter [Phycisphaerae bacterium]